MNISPGLLFQIVINADIALRGQGDKRALRCPFQERSSSNEVRAPIVARRRLMKYSLSAVQAAKVLGTTEPFLAHTVRSRKVDPEPQIIAGRRFCHREQILQAGRALGLTHDDLLRRVESVQEATRAP